MADGMTRGPLPAEVYWRRRLIVLGVALLLVVGLARVLGVGSDAQDGATAAQAGAEASSTPGATDPEAPDAAGAADASEAPEVGAAPEAELTKKEVRAARQVEKRAARQAGKVAEAAAAQEAARIAAAAAPEPQGACADTDVVVTPSLPSPVAGGDIPVVLDLRTRFSPACSWTVSPDSLALKITSGPDNIFSTQQCPDVVPTQDLVLRRAATTQVQLIWNGKRSDADCSGRTDWALTGFYYVQVAALAGEPSDVQFELINPQPAQVVETVPAQPGTRTKAERQARQKARSLRQAERAQREG